MSTLRVWSLVLLVVSAWAGGYMSCQRGWFSSWIRASKSVDRQKAEQDDLILRLATANVELEVINAMKRGDQRYVGYYGPGLVTPGVAHPEQVNIIEGYQDFVTTFSQEQLNTLVHQYARRYNEVLLYILEQQGNGAQAAETHKTPTPKPDAKP